jgi:predicted AAA+ superfamily ATPase
LETHQELGEFLKSLRDHDVVLLDEVSFVKDWDRAVKHAVDSGYPRMLVVTGSHAHDLKRGVDRMPGRFDGGGEFSLLPMSFEEFQQARRDAGWVGDDRLAELRTYFRVGGFPTAVAEAGAEGKRPKKAISTYWRLLRVTSFVWASRNLIYRKFLFSWH